ncbi:ATP-dependent DNA helicase [Trichonephila inaurata madagascariensis]|uniref:ATP-dependent DNA helicase n=1 Tax=Trichonephila inaurata madagascariensis TaxID=2747483 RepID=A0A8X6YBE4_9ARAC|nr:ATP-dependent DNA helicase [Trichonephila inaurata madagascariensis]
MNLYDQKQPVNSTGQDASTNSISSLWGQRLGPGYHVFLLTGSFRKYPTRAQVDVHNTAALDRYRAKEVRVFKIRSQDFLINTTRNADNANMNNIVSDDIKKTGWLQKELGIFYGVTEMFRSNIDVEQ